MVRGVRGKPGGVSRSPISERSHTRPSGSRLLDGASPSSLGEGGSGEVEVCTDLQ